MVPTFALNLSFLVLEAIVIELLKPFFFNWTHQKGTQLVFVISTLPAVKKILESQFSYFLLISKFSV